MAGSTCLGSYEELLYNGQEYVNGFSGRVKQINQWWYSYWKVFERPMGYHRIKMYFYREMRVQKHWKNQSNIQAWIL